MSRHLASSPEERPLTPGDATGRRRRVSLGGKEKKAAAACGRLSEFRVPGGVWPPSLPLSPALCIQVQARAGSRAPPALLFDFLRSSECGGGAAPLIPAKFFPPGCLPLGLCCASAASLAA